MASAVMEEKLVIAVSGYVEPCNVLSGGKVVLEVRFLVDSFLALFPRNHKTGKFSVYLLEI